MRERETESRQSLDRGNLKPRAASINLEDLLKEVSGSGTPAFSVGQHSGESKGLQSSGILQKCILEERCSQRLCMCQYISDGGLHRNRKKTGMRYICQKLFVFCDVCWLSTTRISRIATLKQAQHSFPVSATDGTEVDENCTIKSTDLL